MGCLIPQDDAVFGVAGENNASFNVLLRSKGRNWYSRSVVVSNVEQFENQLNQISFEHNYTQTFKYKQ